MDEQVNHDSIQLTYKAQQSVLQALLAQDQLNDAGAFEELLRLECHQYQSARSYVVLPLGRHEKT